MKVDFLMQEVINAIPKNVSNELFLEIVALKNIIINNSPMPLDEWRNIIYDYVETLLKKYNYVFGKLEHEQKPEVIFLVKLFKSPTKSKFFKDKFSKEANEDYLKELYCLIEEMSVKING